MKISSKYMISNKKHIAAYIVPLIIFALYFFMVGDRYPVHSDQLQSADRALSLNHDQGLVVSSHAHIPPDGKLYATNSPLHTLALYAWFQLFGDFLLAIRGFSYALAALIAICMALAGQRWGILRSPLAISSFLVVVLLSSPLMMSYGYGRYDTIGILICVLIFLAASLESRRIRYLSLFFCGVLLAPVGLQFAAYGFIIGMLVIVWWRKLYIYELMCVGFGGVVGWLLLLLIYAQYGVLESFMNDILFYKQTTAIAGGRFDHIPTALTNSFVNMLFIGLLLVALLRDMIARRPQSIALFGLVSGIVIPVFFSVVGNYTRWYAWMAFLPLVYVAYYELGRLQFRPRILNALLLIFTLVLINITVPITLLTSLTEWDERNFTNVEQFVDDVVTSEDIVLADAYSYMEVKRRAGFTYSYKTLNKHSGIVRSRVNLIFYSHGGGEDGYEVDEILNLMGGQWERVASLEVPRGNLRVKLFGKPKEPFVYEFSVFRRMSNITNE